MTTDQMVDEYLHGASLREIGERAAVSYETVRKRLERRGVERRNGGAPLVSPRYCPGCGIRRYDRKLLDVCADCRKANKREGIVEEVQMFAEEFGRPPAATHFNIAEMRRHPKRYAAFIKYFLENESTNISEIQRYFGSWNNAIRAAGFEPLAAGSGRRG